ncbi:MAG: helix-turn-helix transcriptional regulator [Bacteroidota bacterium]
MENTGFPTTFSELANQKYGAEGSQERTDFQAHAKVLKLGQIIRKKRLEQKLTQQELADRIGSHKSYISKIENGSDLTLSSLFKIFEQGLNTPIHFLFGEVY